MRLRKHQSRIRLAAVTSGAALVLTSLTATGAGAAPSDPDDLSLAEAQPTTTSQEEGPKAPTSALVETTPSLLSLTSAEKVPVLVKYDYDAVASYDGSLPDYEATSPAVTGEPLAEDRPAEQRYRSYVRDQERTITADVRDAVPDTQIIDEFDIVYGGVAALVPGDEIPAILDVPGVVAVQENTLEQPLTDSSTDFIGAPAAYEALGAEATAGDGLVLGNIDTGLWPEHPSFADDGTLSPYEGPEVECNYGDNPLTEEEDPFECNDKLIGGYSFTELYDLLDPEGYLYQGTARDADGHGSHTSGTSAGNIVEDVQTIGPELERIQGVAPGAKVIEYKALGPGGGYTSDLVAAVEQAIIDEVDAINYSISGGSAVTDPIEIAFLNAYDAGIFVAASAGNSGPTASTSNHVSPWVTTVAASTQTRQFTSELTLEADGETFTTEGASIVAGVEEPLPVVLASDAPYSDPMCLEPAPEGLFTDTIVICARGENARVLKGYNVLQGDAAGMVMYNPALADVSTDNHFLPAVQLADGTEMLAWLEGRSDVTGSFTDGGPSDGQGDVIAAFSSRGPAGPVIKPDITAPGVQILAAATPTPETPESGPSGEYYQAIGGTSMSSPHIAGVALLLMATNPDWTPGQIKSAIMTQSITDVVKEDLTTQADPFDMGAGRVDVAASLTAPFTISDTTENFVSLTSDPIRAVDLNIPSINAPTLPGRLTTTRTLENTSGRALVVHPRADAPKGSRITFNPPLATVLPGRSVSFDITITDTSASGEQKFAEITFRTQRGDGHIPVAYVPTQGNVTLDQSCAQETIHYKGDVTCTVTATNESFNEQDVSITTTGRLALKGKHTETVTLDGAELGVPSVADAEGSAFLDLAGFGVAPTAVGDESMVNFNVPAFVYNGRPYSSIGISSNGYLVAGGGTTADNNCCNLPDGPSPAAPNDVLAPFWTDLNSEAGDGTAADGIRATTLTDGVNTWLVVQWDMYVWGTQDDRSFQVWIGVDGEQDITFEYADAMADPGLPFLVGAENAAGIGDMVAELPDGNTKVVTSTEPSPGGSITYDVTLPARLPGHGVVRSELVADEVPGTTVVETPVRVTLLKPRG